MGGWATDIVSFRISRERLFSFQSGKPHTRPRTHARTPPSVLGIATGIPIYRFKTPKWINEEMESYDLALCFHIDNYHASRAVKVFKLSVIFLYCVTLVYVYMSAELEGVGALDYAYFVGFTNAISFYALLRLFPYAEPSSCGDQLTYGEYQTTVLAMRGAHNMANDNSLRCENTLIES